MRLSLIALFASISIFCRGQFPERFSSSELYHQLLKAANTSSILYMAAHPDDENTRLISYFENKLHARTAYLSLTRGDGGQNLIGTEIGSSIGILRTQELLAARDIDGGEQFFSRAVDFGYSKSAKESFEKWGRQNILRDAVWVIRKFRPDAIVTRFPPNNYAGHGHHEASAITAEEIFNLAADENSFPEQLEFVEPWQPKRLYFNTSTWWVKDLEDQAKNTDDYIKANVGEFNDLLGESYSQIASRSRSEHKSQGFGSDYPMGNQTEYMKYVMGDKVKKGESILYGIDTGWERTDSPEAGRILLETIASYDFSNPSASVSGVIEALKKIAQNEGNALLKRKRAELEELALRLAGIEMQATTKEFLVVPGSEIQVDLKINSTSSAEVKLKAISGFGFEDNPEKTLVTNDFYYSEAILEVDQNMPISNPYWLNSEYENIYAVEGYTDLGKPENDPSFYFDITFEISGYTFTTRLDLQNKEVDPAKAVLYNPVYVVPEITAGFDEKTIVTSRGQSKTISVKAQSHKGKMSGVLRPEAPNGWICTPPEIQLDFNAKGETKLVSFTISPEGNPSLGEIGLAFEKSDGSVISLQNLRLIEYDHIPTQLELSPSKVKIVPIDLNFGGIAKIGYIEGPGDEVAKYLRSVGYEVEVITEDVLVSGNFDAYDAIVTGIRAFNTREDLDFSAEALNRYVENGGTWLVQYNTSRRLKSEKMGPFDFKLSRERVTDETAVPTFLYPDHQVLKFPNEISSKDFEGWIQERGLYFASEWDTNFTPILGWSDPEEPSRNGGLLIANHGKGHFVYSGISFFRELPAGVPGAFRLLANILALSNSEDGKE